MRSAGPNLHACFDQSALWMGASPPLARGETIGARQELDGRCQLRSADADPVTVQDNTPVPAANVPRLCADSTAVVLNGLVMGFRVQILANGVELGMAESPLDGTHGFRVPPLAGGAMSENRHRLIHHGDSTWVRRTVNHKRLWGGAHEWREA